MKRSLLAAVAAAAFALAPAMLHAQTYPITNYTPLAVPVVGPQFVMALTTSDSPLPSPSATQACFYVSDEAATTSTALNIQTGTGVYSGYVTYTVPASYLATIAPADISTSGYLQATVYFVPTGSTCTGMADPAYSGTANILIETPQFGASSTNSLPQTNTALTSASPVLFTVTGKYFSPSSIVQFIIFGNTVNATTKYLGPNALLVTSPTIPSSAFSGELQVVTNGSLGSYPALTQGELGFYAIRQSTLGTPTVTVNPAGAGATLTFAATSQDAGADSQQQGGVPTGAITMTETNSSDQTVGGAVTGTLTTNPISTSFTALSGFTDPNAPFNPSTVIADFNGDGVPDVLVVDNEDGANFLTVYPGAYPLGNFGSSVTTVMPSGCTGVYGLAYGDVNGDGVPDVAVLCGDNDMPDLAYFIMLGNGDGTFTYSNVVDTGQANGLALGDFFHHGKLDLAAIGTDSTETYTQINLYPGNGDGTFGATTITLLNNPNLGFPDQPILTTDIDGDGYADMVVNVGSDIVVLVSNGDGTVGNAAAGTPNYDYSAGFGGGMVDYAAAADVNNDGKTDIIFTGNVNPEIAHPRHAPSSRDKMRAAAARRGIALPAASEKSPAAIQPLGLAAQRSQRSAADSPAAAKPDAAKPKAIGPNIVALLNTSTPGAVSFATPVTSTVPAVADEPIAVANFDGDCCNDVLLTDNTNFIVYSGNNTGAFTASDTNLLTPLPSGTIQTLAVAGLDLNGDGAADLVYSVEIPGSGTNQYSVSEALTTGTASASTVGNPGLPPGTYTVNYTYNGNSLAYTGSTTTLNPLTITTEGTTTTVMASQPSVVFGQSESLTATITQGATTSYLPTGTVTFLQGTTNVLGTVAVSGGQAVLNGVQLPVGSYTVKATYSGDTYNAGSAGTTSFTVTQATPTITWAAPAAIPYGTALSATQLDATSGGVAGAFVYTPAAGTVLAVGSHTLSVAFTPTDTTDYTNASGSANLFVNAPENALYSFCAQPSCADGTDPEDAIIQAADGYYYGTVDTGGALGLGAFFRVSSTGQEATLYSFGTDSGDGTMVAASLVQGTDGNFYGATQRGGANGAGAVFQVTPAGAQTTLYSFTSDAAGSVSGLVEDSSGNFYGTKAFGGANNGGTIFKLSPSGGTFTFATIYPFCSQAACADGNAPFSGLVQGTDGDFYGTTEAGGANNAGTVYKITPGGAFTLLHSFSGSDGQAPYGGLVQAADGNFYGTTRTGGGTSSDGTVYRMTPGGTVTTLYSFSGTDGANPYFAVLALGSDGNFYGTTSHGGGANDGTVFQITSAGALTTLYSFCSQASCTDGNYPIAGVVQGADGNFYGTTADGGAASEGAVYEVSPATLAAPVQLSLSSSSITLGAPVTLSWNSLNAFSGTMQQCAAILLNGATAAAAGNWTGLQSGTLVAGVYSGSASISPTVAGTYTYGLTCGGVESAAPVSLTVNQATPTITWAAPAAITYGTALSATQLDATSGGVAGTFVYTPPSGTVLAAGSQTLSVTFTPTDTTDYSTATKTVGITVNQATPTITWATPAAITYGTALSATQLDATSGGVAGTFVYTPPSGTVLAAGSQTLSVTFTPTDTTDYSTATKTVGITVNQATPTLTWAAPAAITYGTALSATQLDATSGGVAGTFVYTPPSGTVLAAGSQTLSVTFTPTDTTDYSTATKTVGITVNQATPTLTWAAPAAITYGTALSATQLDATSGGVAGTFVYTPPSGTVLAAGSQTLSVTFTPTDTTDYSTATKTVGITVNQATPTLTWATPAAITYGTALSATQLDATSGGVAGTFVYTPPSGTVLAAGSQTLSVTFTPTDTTDYSTATKTVGITVNQATPTITWATPAAITYGTALSATQLDATSGGVAGTFVYTPPSGTVLAAGTQTLSVTFTPTDTTDYSTATKTVGITVNQATPTLTWATPAAITYGTALSATQLDAASGGVAGTFVYTPPSGTVLAAGTQTLSVTFTPTDTTDYSTATKTVGITVNQATPTLTWATPAAITYGIALSATQLDATAGGVGGTFVYTPPSGTVLAAGSQTLSVTFTPTDTTDYSTATKTVGITVNQATPTLTWAAPAAITYGTALSATQLDATSGGVAGTFVYTPPSGTVLAAGSQTLSVTFTPTDTTDYSTATKTVGITVNQATPTLTWAAPAAITYGTALSATQLDATSGGVAGTFVYTPPSGTVLAAGNQTLSVTFTPTDTTDYTTATKSVGITVNQATPTLTWATPAAITYGTALSATQLDATSGGVAGTFVYTPPSGTVLAAGSQTLSVTFTPTDTTDYSTATKTVGITVNQATPTITWAAPAPIAYGTALSATQLDATATGASGALAGTFVYTPPAGTVLSAGNQTLSVTFTPTDTTDYTTATKTVPIAVGLTTPTLTWAAPSPIAYGTALSVTQLDATATGTSGPLAGTFAYTPPAGTVLTAGNQTLSVTFTPTDTTDYSTATKTVSITVTQASPTLTWAAPSAIAYGTALSATQLDATAAGVSGTLAGTFVYTPPAGTVLTAGSHTLSVTFTPTDTTDYTTATKTVSITVNQTTPTLTWTAPSAIAYGTALSATQLDATATGVSGTLAGGFVYTPATGTVLDAGSHTLSVTFTPTDTTDYTTATKTVSITVNQATPTLSWTAPSAIAYGTALSATQLDATATGVSGTLAGTFAYTPPTGTVLAAGTQTLSVTFTPTDSTDYSTATKTVSITVSQATPGITWSNPAAITYGTALSNVQLDATASGTSGTLPGTFVYTPPSGTVLAAGTQTLSVAFTPTDTTDYTTATKTVSLTVGQATPTVTWSNPAAISYGTSLSATQLDATSGGVAGTFAYTPPTGTVLAAGSQTLSVTFTPTDTTDYTTATKTVSLTVGQAVLTVTANNLSMEQGQAVPTLTYAITGFQNSDTQASSTTGAPSLATTATPASLGGTYPITITQGTLAASNYTFNPVNGTLTVTAFLVLSVSPNNVPAGSGDTLVTVTGQGFSANDSVLVNGTPLSTAFNSPAGTLSATIPAAYLMTKGTTLPISVEDNSTGVTTASTVPFVVGPSVLGVTTTSLPNVTVNTAYNTTLTASGGVAPYTWSVISGSLPMGLMLDTNTGAISGTPTVIGTTSFTVQASDAETTPMTMTAVLAIGVNATQSLVYDFCVTNAACPDGQGPTELIQADDGNFYGVTEGGGANHNNGTFYQLTTAGTQTVLYNFCSLGADACTDGGTPVSLVLGGDGNFYGITTSGGAYGAGTIFKATPAGTLTTLYSFCGTGAPKCSDGYGSDIQLTPGSDGNFYGVASEGGADGYGTAFKITPGGTFSLLYTFTGGADGSLPNGLLQASDGNFYGITQTGGNSNAGCTAVTCGTIFQLTPAGALTTIYSFCPPAGGTCSGGNYPEGVLNQGADGDLYGATQFGGPENSGTIFKVSTSGTFTNLDNLCSGGGTTLCDASDGSPQNGLFLGSDGNFYGASGIGGNSTGIDGAAFQITPAGALTVAYNFCSLTNCDDGSYPTTPPVQGNDGNFYGATNQGGSTNGPGNAGGGVIYKLTGGGLPAPVQMTLSSTSATYGSPVTLSWKVLNAFSTTAQQCYAFVVSGGTSAGNWTGLQAGTLAAGVYSGSATLSPTAAGTYTYGLTCGGVESALPVSLTVSQATPSLTWAAPSAISYGTALSATQLDATATGVSGMLAGTFVYTPGAGTVLSAGTQTLSVTFTPTDTTDYTTATTTVSITVNQTTPTLSWTAPSAISYGTALSATQLDATASSTSGTLAGTFVYTPAAGTVLAAGTQTLSVTFTPTDATDYTTATKTVSLTVNQATPGITWSNPAAVTYGTALSATQLDATASGASGTLPGAFVYTPAAGTVLAAGTQTLSVTFTPTDTADYTTATKTVSLTVNQATLTVTADNLSIEQGQAIPTLTYAITGFQNGDMQATATSGAPSLSTTATTASPGGTYPITVEQGTLAATNYTFSLVNGTLTVSAFSITSLNPSSAPAGSSDTPVTIAGPGFSANDTVLVNGTAVVTFYNPNATLTGVVPAADLTTQGTTLQISVIDNSTSVTTAAVPFTVGAGVLSLTTFELSNVTVNTTYSATLAATGGTAPYTWKIIAGSLPLGLSLNATSGVISGTPTVPSSPAFTVQATDSESTPMTATAVLSIGVNAVQTVLYGFCQTSNCADGEAPSGIIQADDGSFYGITQNGGANAGGEVFKLVPGGTQTVLYNFCSQGGSDVCSDGSTPAGNLVQGSDGNFYGATTNGGAYLEGSIFKLTPAGTLTTLYSFCSAGPANNCPDGLNPPAGLIQGSDGNFYGVTGSASLTIGAQTYYYYGTIFKISPAGQLTTLYTFTGGADGNGPNQLLQGNDGNFYGTAISGGNTNSSCYQGSCGTVFQITPTNAFTALYAFCASANCPDGNSPAGPLTQGKDGNLYGATSSGGSEQSGTAFKVSTAGALTILYNFCSFTGNEECFDGNRPGQGFTLGSDGNFYGATTNGGNSIDDNGTAFQLTPAGTLTTVYDFCSLTNCSDGADPVAAPIQGNDGNFYGVTTGGGNNAVVGGPGVFYQLTATGLQAPVQLTLSSASASLGTPVTLNWQVLNAFSTTAQQCNAFVLSGGATAGNWAGQQTGTLAAGVYSGSASITPTATGTYTYGFTCGGVESASPVTLTVATETTTTALASSLPSPVYGTPISLTATITPGAVGGAASTASVSFYDGTTLLGTVASSGFSATLTSVALAAGTHSLSAVFAGDANYQTSTGTENLPVTPAVLTVTANNLSKEQGQANPTLTYGITGFQYSDTQASSTTGAPALSTTATQASPGGTYPINIAQGTLAATNYTFGFVNGTLTVGGFFLTSTSPNSAPAGSAATTITLTGLGFSANDSVLVNGTAVTTNFAAANSLLTAIIPATDLTAPTTLQISVKDTSTNIITSTVPFTVTTVSTTTGLAASAQSPTYGVPVSLTATVTPQNQAGASTATVTFYDGSTQLGTAASSGFSATLTGIKLAAGTHSLSAVFAGDSTYATSTGNLSLTVSKAVLTVTANNLGKQQGTANPTLTYTITGFQYADTQASATTGAPALSTTATTTSPAGTYPITITQGTLAAGNYTFGFVNGTLTVGGFFLTSISPNSAPAGSAATTITLTGLGFSANDSVLVNGTAVTTNFAAANSLLTAIIPAADLIAPATLQISVKDTSTNIITSTVPFTVTTVSTTTGLAASAQSPTYGVPISLTATITPQNQAGASTATVTFYDGSTQLGAAASSGFSATLTGVQLAAGAHSLSAIFAGDTVYQTSTGNLSLTVAKAVLTVTANNLSKQQGAANPTLTYTITGFQYSDTQANSTAGAPVLFTTATQTSPVGTYPITITQGKLIAANYTFSFVNGTLTVGANGLTLNTTSLPIAKAGTTYRATLTASGGVTPYTWSIVAGALPTGLSLNSATGVISGKPTAPGVETFTVQVADSESTPMTQTEPLGIAVNSNEAVIAPLCPQSGCPDGIDPRSAVIEASDGNLYGAAYQGGPANDGAIFKISPKGALSLLYAFCTQTNCPDGEFPQGMVQGPDGALYGTTFGTMSGAGGSNFGTVFRITTTGTLTTLYSFCAQSGCTDGEGPGNLTVGNDGNLYGATSLGGANGKGSLFKITPAGAFTQIYSFCATAGCPDGSQPSSALMQASDGNFYGVTNFGGSQNSGLLYKLTPGGAVTQLYSFCQLNDCADGSAPDSVLVQGANGDLYGATDTGGSADDGALFDITLNGTFTLLDSFTGANGNSPNDLVLGSDGNFYGTSQSLGEGNGGTFFELTPAGAQTTLYTFCSQAGCADGGTPEGLLQASDGQFYGTASTGGPNGGGAIVQLPLTPALPAPVQLSLNSSSIALGNPVRLTFNVLNAFSETMQQCYAFVQNAATGAGNWTGLQTGALTSGVYTGTASITPTAVGTYTYALTCGGVESGFSGALTVTPAQINFTLASIAPNTTNIGAPDTTITLTGTGFDSTDQAQVNGTSIATTFVNQTTLTAVIPAADLATSGTLQISVYQPKAQVSTNALPFTVTIPPVSLVFSGPSTATSASQPDLTFTLTNPYPVELTATLTLAFEGVGGVDDPNVVFANGSRTYAFNIAANTTATPTIQLQTGTDEGTITVTLAVAITSTSQDVTPTDLPPVTITIPAAAPTITSMTLTRSGDTITVNIMGYSNPRDMAQATLTFTGADGASLDDPDITVPAATLFTGWYSTVPSQAFGSEFLYTQTFNLSADNSTIGQVMVTLSNSAGISGSATAQ